MMMEPAQFQAFMRRYFPVFLLGFFTSLISVALAATFWVDSHWRNHPDNPFYTLVSSGSLVLLLCLGHFVMIRGLRWAMWPVLAVQAVAFLMALSLIGIGLSPIALAITLALPLLAVLVYNSARHREMRQRLVELRRQR